MKSLPKDLAVVIKFGKVPNVVVKRFMELEKSMAFMVVNVVW